MIRLIEQMKRAHTFGLDVRFDEHTFTFFIADAATNTVVAPPPMNIPTVEAMAGRLRERSSRRMTLQGDILAVASVLWYNMSVVQTLFPDHYNA